MTDRPEYITCIAHTHAERKHQTWCGKHTVGFVFQDIDHAAYNGMQQGRLLTCPECLDAVVKALQGGA